MEGFLNTVKDVFVSIFSAVRDFFVMIWNAFIGLLSKFLPEGFAMMLAIIILCIVVLALVKAFLYKK